MYFVLAKNNRKKKNYKVVAVISKEYEMIIATTKHFGYATEIARMFDESFKNKDCETIIEVR